MPVYTAQAGKKVIVDDFFPCDPSTGKPIFSSSNGNELWVLLLEKAWAKVYGSYGKIVGGFPHEPLHDLTGAPTVFYSTEDVHMEDEIWDEILQGEENNYVMTCSTKSDKTMNGLYIYADHAYSLLGAFDLKVGGKRVRLVKLRNPWGHTEWIGDWSDLSPKWTPELRECLQVEDQDDGIFFMSYEDMFEFFSDVEICKVHDNYAYNSIKSSYDHRQTPHFKLNVLQSGHYYITINQENERKYAAREKYSYSMVYVHLQKKIGDKYRQIKAIQGKYKEVWLDEDLDQGEYLVSLKLDWNKVENKEFSISSYGPGDTEIKEINPPSIQKKAGSKNTHQQPTQTQDRKLNFEYY